MFTYYKNQLRKMLKPFEKLAVLQTAPCITDGLGQLLEIFPSLLQSGSENLKIVFKILECYILLGKNAQLRNAIT